MAGGFGGGDLAEDALEFGGGGGGAGGEAFEVLLFGDEVVVVALEAVDDFELGGDLAAEAIGFAAEAFLFAEGGVAGVDGGGADFAFGGFAGFAFGAFFFALFVEGELLGYGGVAGGFLGGDAGGLGGESGLFLLGFALLRAALGDHECGEKNRERGERGDVVGFIHG